MSTQIVRAQYIGSDKTDMGSRRTDDVVATKTDSTCCMAERLELGGNGDSSVTGSGKSASEYPRDIPTLESKSMAGGVSEPTSEETSMSGVTA